MASGQEANADNLGKFVPLVFDLLNKNGMMSVLIRIASMRRFLIHRTYKFRTK